jgi:hypothetical protein
MSRTDKSAIEQDKTDENNVAGERCEFEAGSADLADALKNFRMSVHAWGDAAYSRPRSSAQIVRQRSWRLVAGWALAGLLMAGGLSGGLIERHHLQEQARIAAQRMADQQRLAREQQSLQREEQAKDEENLLATVDSDVSREVPSAMEPLAQLMDGETK